MAEDKVDAIVGSDVPNNDVAPGTPDGNTPKPKRNRKKLGIVVGVLAAIVIVAGAGVWVWHEQPSFCNAFCHSPMDPALTTYEGTSGQVGYDKWGNEVADAGDMLVVAHKEQAGATCMTCHQPVMAQQVNEGMHWVPGNYLYPLDERSLTELNGYDQHETAEEFCLNENCHNMTRSDLALTTASMERNPHVTEVNHQILECSDCHKAHRQSVMACSRCHSDADIPEGWLSAEEAAKLGA